MSHLPFASKSPKGKPSNGTKPTGAMTNFKVRKATGHNPGNHPTTARGK